MITIIHIGELLKELRGNRSLREIERISGVSHTYLSSIEKGVDPRSGNPITPTHDTLKKLAKAYNYPYPDLLEKAGFFDGIPNEKKELLKERYQILDSLDHAIHELLEEMKSDNGLFHKEFKNQLIEIIDDAEGYDDTVDFDTYYTAKKIHDIISNYDSTEWKAEIIHELTRIIRNYKEKTEIDIVLLRPNVNYKGQTLTNDDRKRILDMLTVLFPERNKN